MTQKVVAIDKHPKNRCRSWRLAWSDSRIAVYECNAGFVAAVWGGEIVPQCMCIEKVFPTLRSARMALKSA